MSSLTVPLSPRQHAQIETARADVDRATLVLNTYVTAAIDGTLDVPDDRKIIRWDVTAAGLVVTFAKPPLNVDPPALSVVRDEPNTP